MVPKHVYDKLPEEEKILWHSHKFEVKSGMLILPKPAALDEEEWEKVELEAMKEIVGLYGKTWHFWEVDAGHEVPMGTFTSHLTSLVLEAAGFLREETDQLSSLSGHPHLMGSVIQADQVDLDQAMAKRNKAFNVDHAKKAEARKHIEVPVISDCEYLPCLDYRKDRESDLKSRCRFMVDTEREQQRMIR